MRTWVIQGVRIDVSAVGHGCGHGGCVVLPLRLMVYIWWVHASSTVSPRCRGASIVLTCGSDTLSTVVDTE